MIPPVSLPLNGGTGSRSARADWLAIIPKASRPAAAMIRIPVTPIGWRQFTVSARRWKERMAGPTQHCGQLVGKCCRAALDLLRPSRHRPTLADHAVWITHARLDLPEIAPLCRRARPPVRGAVAGGSQGRQSAGAEFLAERAALRRQRLRMRQGAADNRHPV